MFIDRCTVYMGDFMNYEGTNKYLTEMTDAISTEYPIHRKQMNQGWPNYSEKLNNRISPADHSMLSVTVNGIPLIRGEMNGKFFKDRRLTIKAKTTDKSKTVTGWKVLTVKGGQSEEKTYNGETLTLTMPECTQFMIDAIIGENENGIISPAGNIKDSCSKKTYNMQGQDMTGHSLKAGLYIIKRGGKSQKMTIR